MGVPRSTLVHLLPFLRLLLVKGRSHTPPSIFGFSYLCLASPIYVWLLLSMFGCSFLCLAAPSYVWLLLPMFGCSYLCLAAPSYVWLLLPMCGCSCLCLAAPSYVWLLLSMFGCSFLPYCFSPYPPPLPVSTMSLFEPVRGGGENLDNDTAQ